MSQFGEVMLAFAEAFRALNERVDELERLETYYGTLDLNGKTLSVLDDLTLNAGTTNRLVGYTSGNILGDSSLAKTGAGLLTLIAANNYSLTVAASGTLNLAGGTLDFPVDVTQGGTGATSAAAARTNLGVPALIHTHAAADVTSGVLLPARLGSGSATSVTTLHGDSSWSVLDIVTESTGTLPLSRGGTGATSASAALTALGGAAASHSHDAGAIVTGALAVARGGTGATTAAAALSALGGAPLGHSHTGMVSVSGSTVNGEIPYFNGTNIISGDTGLYYDPSTNAVTASIFNSAPAGTSGYYLTERDGSGTWALYATSSIFRIWSGSDRLTVDSSGNLVISGTLKTQGGVAIDFGSWSSRGDGPITGQVVINIGGVVKTLATI